MFEKRPAHADKGRIPLPLAPGKKVHGAADGVRVEALEEGKIGAKHIAVEDRQGAIAVDAGGHDALGDHLRLAAGRRRQEDGTVVREAHASTFGVHEGYRVVDVPTDAELGQAVEIAAEARDRVLEQTPAVRLEDIMRS